MTIPDGIIDDVFLSGQEDHHIETVLGYVPPNTLVTFLERLWNTQATAAGTIDEDHEDFYRLNVALRSVIDNLVRSVANIGQKFLERHFTDEAYDEMMNLWTRSIMNVF